jgi:hypothetical protein
VTLDPDDVVRKSPDRLKDRFARRLRALFGDDNVKVGDLAVTVTVRGKEGTPQEREYHVRQEALNTFWQYGGVESRL